MEAKTFFDCWTDFAQQVMAEQDGLVDLWTDYGEWTRRTIGSPRSEGIGAIDPSARGGSPFGDHFIAQFGQRWRYWKEDRNIDLAMSAADNFEMTWWNDPGSPMTNEFYPRCYGILVEQEAIGSRAWQEFVKLIHMRAKLKVMITYTGDVWGSDTDGKKSEGLMHHMRKTFTDMIAQAASECSEDEDTKYLLIFGQNIQHKIHWHGWVIDQAGGCIEDQKLHMNGSKQS